MKKHRLFILVALIISCSENDEALDVSKRSYKAEIYKNNIALAWYTLYPNSSRSYRISMTQIDSIKGSQLTVLDGEMSEDIDLDYLNLGGDRRIDSGGCVILTIFDEEQFILSEGTYCNDELTNKNLLHMLKVMDEAYEKGHPVNSSFNKSYDWTLPSEMIQRIK